MLTGLHYATDNASSERSETFVEVLFRSFRNEVKFVDTFSLASA